MNRNAPPFTAAQGCKEKIPYGRLGSLWKFRGWGGIVMKFRKQVHYVKGVFVCPQCNQTFVQERWIEEFRVRCHKCDYRGTLTHVSVEEHMDEEIGRM